MDYVSQLRPCPHGLSWIDKRENLLTMTRLIPLQPSGNTEKRLKPDKVGSSFHHVSPSSADSKSEDQTLPCFVEGFWLSTLGSEEHNAKSIIRWHMGHWHTMIRHLHYIGSTLVQSVFFGYYTTYSTLLLLKKNVSILHHSNGEQVQVQTDHFMDWGRLTWDFMSIESSVSQPSQCITIIKSYQDISSPMVFQTYLRSGQGTTWSHLDF